MGAEGTYAAHVGSALPLGAHATARGTNFAIYARNDAGATLVLRDGSGAELDFEAHRTGHVWHVEVAPAVEGWAWRWRVGGRLCLDPWARAVDSAVGPATFNRREGGEYEPWGVVEGAPFDWEDVPRPKVPWEDVVIYELHVRGFSVTSGGGAFRDVVDRIPYFKALGVNVIELLPIMEFNEEEWSCIDPSTGKPLCQYWGYSTVAFFAPMNRFGSDGGKPADVVREFRTMVRELHRAGIEVFLDVVYNHTAEMGLDYVGPGFYGMKELAPTSYYIMEDGGKKFVNHSGCGNTMSCNNQIVQDMICESLRYWAHSMGVDGFRFDLASVLCRNTDGTPLEKPPVIERMTKDASMRDVKLIAEPWDCGNLYQVGTFPHYGVWAEWNGMFRDCIRKFVKGDGGMISDFATRLCGSKDLYGHDGRKPYHSINFVTAHDGFSLYDMVAYNEKHNEHNGENNNDGEQHNNSWNCGVEGETNDPGIVDLRRRQMKNMLVALLVSAGTPMLCMGDEYGHTQNGNNNGWCQNSPLTWFSWEAAKKQKDQLLRFTQKLTHLRHTTPALRHTEFLSDADVTWHGSQPHSPDWNSSYNFIAFSFSGPEQVYIAFNAGGEERTVKLPGVDGGPWYRVIDTNLPSPRDFSQNPREKKLDPESTYKLMPYSCILLKQYSEGSNDEVAEKTDQLIASAFDVLNVDGSVQ